MCMPLNDSRLFVLSRNEAEIKKTARKENKTKGMPRTS